MYEPELFTPVPGNRLNTGKPLIKMKNRLSPKRWSPQGMEKGLQIWYNVVTTTTNQRRESQLPEYEVVMNMYGVGESTGPQLMAEIGDVTRFERKQSLVAFAALITRAAFSYSGNSDSAVRRTPNLKPLIKQSHSFRQLSSVHASFSLPKVSASLSFSARRSYSSSRSTSLASLSVSLSGFTSRS